VICEADDKTILAFELVVGLIEHYGLVKLVVGSIFPFHAFVNGMEPYIARNHGRPESQCFEFAAAHVIISAWILAVRVVCGVDQLNVNPLLTRMEAGLRLDAFLLRRTS